MNSKNKLTDKFKARFASFLQRYPFLINTLPEKVKPMATKTNIILLILVLWSAYYVVDLSNSIKQETQLYGKAQERGIRLDQDFAELQYSLSQAVDTKIINNAASKMNMHEPSVEETVILDFQ
ncbi:cell division protein FtsL [Simonsiella muelleri]|jgi:hypothetical protein|uniref:Cell division protein FtsL n=2 Tax=Simonsiella TaxID=71 RepID=V9H8M6_9NEIS|nr:cell division protein FtsL [Simonsiella muelleri]EFG31123.1 hypothetical protein HMPREF9021_00952 [Simonsiella muelleri ATCC 29453]UBQ53416.1 cell division protein FtsL [Simonsiella muelleri]